jgi:hypothetical protein
LESDDIVLVFDGRSIHTRWVEPPPAILSRRDLTFDRGPVDMHIEDAQKNRNPV